MDREKRGGDRSVGAQHRNWLGAGVREELSVRGGEEQGGQRGRLVGVEEGREALREEERRCMIRMGHLGV